jgi:hypothetical protein
MGQNSSVVVAAGWMAGVRFPRGSSDFLIVHNVKTVFGAHPASYTMGKLSP